MNNNETSSDAFANHVASLGPPVVGEGASTPKSRMADFCNAVELLHELTHAGLEDVDEQLQKTILRLGKLADSVEGSLSDCNDDDPDVFELVNFVIESCEVVRNVAVGDSSSEIDPDFFISSSFFNSSTGLADAAVCWTYWSNCFLASTCSATARCLMPDPRTIR